VGGLKSVKTTKEDIRMAKRGKRYQSAIEKIDSLFFTYRAVFF
jgi:hypothetical protein